MTVADLSGVLEFVDIRKDVEELFVGGAVDLPSCWLLELDLAYFGSVP